MKIFKYYVVFVSLFALLPNLSKGLCIKQSPGIKAALLIASKNKKIISYKIGNSLSVLSGVTDKKINGRLLAITTDSISIQQFNEKNAVSKVAINDIYSIVKLHKDGRKGWITALSVLVGLTIWGIILLESKTFLAGIVLAAPVVSLYTFIPFLVGSFLSDLISKKSIKKGWVFTTK